MNYEDVRVLELNSSDNKYLHKDFHGALCYAVKHIDENFGQDATREYLRQVGLNNYSKLIADLKVKGLSALEKHFREIFEIENCKADFKLSGDDLVITVSQCPAILHLIKIGQLFTNRYCETTVNVNHAICKAAGYECSCEYVPGKGKCVQKFWKAGVK
jgi:hypothetical protein